MNNGIYGQPCVSWKGTSNSSLNDTGTLCIFVFIFSENNERDLVILRHTIGFETSGGRQGTEEINLTVYGESYGGLSAMAKCVGYPAGIATKMILEGKLNV